MGYQGEALVFLQAIGVSFRVLLRYIVVAVPCYFIAVLQPTPEGIGIVLLLESDTHPTPLEPKHRWDRRHGAVHLCTEVTVEKRHSKYLLLGIETERIDLQITLILHMLVAFDFNFHRRSTFLS